jgi:hypothetical protein
MKTSKFFLAALTVMCAMTTVLTACGSDNDDDNNTPRTAEVKGIGAHYTFSVTEQMSQLCDYTITYYGIGGKLETEKVTWAVTNGVATWEKTVSNTTFPATFGIKVSVSVKSDAQLEGVKVDNVYPLNVEMYLEGITTDGKKAWSKTVDLRAGVTNHVSPSGEKLQSFLDAMENHGGMVNKYYTLDKDGNEIASGTME